jgi:hypothetical protein
VNFRIILDNFSVNSGHDDGIYRIFRGRARFPYSTESNGF